MADQLKAGAEKVIANNTESYVAIIDAQRLGRERVHLLLLSDATSGLSDVAAGRVKNAQTVLAATLSAHFPIRPTQ